MQFPKCPLNRGSREVTSDLPSTPIPFDSRWNHLSDRSNSGRFVVLLPRRDDVKQLGESPNTPSSKSVRRYLSLERSLLAKDQKSQFDEVMKEYLDFERIIVEAILVF